MPHDQLSPYPKGGRKWPAGDHIFTDNPWWRQFRDWPSGPSLEAIATHMGTSTRAQGLFTASQGTYSYRKVVRGGEEVEEVRHRPRQNNQPFRRYRYRGDPNWVPRADAEQDNGDKELDALWAKDQPKPVRRRRGPRWSRTEDKQ